MCVALHSLKPLYLYMGLILLAQCVSPRPKGERPEGARNPQVIFLILNFELERSD